MLRRTIHAGLRHDSQYLLTVPGTQTGEPQSTPVSLATVDGIRYVIAAFTDAAWVKDVRASGSATLSRGDEMESVHLEEIPVDAREPVLRAFLRQVRGGARFFGSQTPDQIAAAAERYPVFRVSN